MIGIIGAGGHAKVTLDILSNQSPGQLVTFFADTVDPFFHSYPRLPGDRNTILSMQTIISTWHVAIGDSKTRGAYLDFLKEQNLPTLNALHEKSIIASSVKLGDGISVIGAAVINPGATIGDGCIINTSATVDHDCTLSSYVNIGPGSHLAGNVTVGKNSDLGAGVIVIPGVTIGEHCTIGAGSVVINDIPDHALAVGVPARVIKTNI
ncbi:acetyltransferase [Alteribacter aurantiacus]|uniref:acetyltransferase n=1 Tax=Alteribacter aurantiacus TaxID=254410 RepID=UPI0004030832|nr:acetyltransferase [Alteribacter aurantiacus]